jgi:uncharacterized protein (DUF342 family)
VNAPDTNTNQDFRVSAQSDGTWVVQFQLPVQELLDQKVLLRRLRRIKRQIADSHGIPEGCLLFDGILERREIGDMVEAVVRLRRNVVEAGESRIYFRDGIGADRTHYLNMTALLDLFYLDFHEEPETREHLQTLIREAGIRPDLVDHELVDRSFDQVVERQTPIHEIAIAQGRFPDHGTDADLTLPFALAANPQEDGREYFSARAVKRGEILCRKSEPTSGRFAGYDVKGVILPPQRGLDIALNAGPGAMLSIDGKSITADANGIAVVLRTMRTVPMLWGHKEIPATITLKVNPATRIEGDNLLDVATGRTVEVMGSVHFGSRIITDCEAYVHGNVEAGTLLEAADQITVHGQIHGGKLVTHGSVIAERDVSNARIAAADQIVIKGSAQNSDLVADSVVAGALAGGTIVAQRKVVLDRVDADAGQVASTVYVGARDYLRQRMAENHEFIRKTKANLLRLEMLLGRDILEKSTATNTSIMLRQFLRSQRHLAGDMDRNRIETVRKLIESITPLRALVEQKECENLELLERLTEVREQNGSITIHDRLTAPAKISVDGVQAEVKPQSGPLELRTDGQGNLVLSHPPRNPDHH